MRQRDGLGVCTEKEKREGKKRVWNFFVFICAKKGVVGDALGLAGKTLFLT